MHLIYMGQVTSSWPVKTPTSSNVVIDIFLVMGGLLYLYYIYKFMGNPRISPEFFPTPPPPPSFSPLLNKKNLIHQVMRE